MSLKPYYQDEFITLYCGDVREVLKQLPENSVHTVVTSPPYYGLRDYGIDGQIGLEETPTKFIEEMQNVFADVRRVMRKDATLWLNLGDSYAGSGKGGQSEEKRSKNWQPDYVKASDGNFKPKDLMLIPHRTAIALQDDGFWVRQDVVWQKPNPMPESVTDRCTKAHEYIFLMSKSASYFYDADAVKEPVAENSRSRLSQDVSNQNGSGRVPGKTNGNMKAVGTILGRNRRSVWSITSKPFAEAHFATFPPELPRICISAATSEKGCCAVCGSQLKRIITKELVATAKASFNSAFDERDELANGYDQGGNRQKDGHKPGHINQTTTIGWQPTCECESTTEPSIVLDPFAGAGTTLIVAKQLGRKSIGIELNPKYCEMIVKRIKENGMPLFD